MLARLRRMLGLFAFFYAVLHLACYAWLDQGWCGAISWRMCWSALHSGGHAHLRAVAGAGADITAWCCAGWGRALAAVHRIVYGAGLLALLHFYWMRAGKNDTAEVAVYGGLLAVLLGWRMWARRKPAAR
jgi:sulfoxide reductase heme-binding subunit YedZ